MLDVTGKRPHLALPHDVDRAGRDHLIVVVDQLQQGFLGVALARPDQDVAAADPLVERHVLEDRHDHLADGAAQEVVEIFGGARPVARVSLRQGPLRGGDVVRRVDQRE